MESPRSSAKSVEEMEFEIKDLQWQNENLNELLSEACELLKNAFDLIKEIEQMFGSMPESWEFSPGSLTADIADFVAGIDTKPLE